LNGKKILYNTLKSIGTGNEYLTSPDINYLKDLETIGFIELGWTNKLTSFGNSVMISLRNKIEE